MQAIDNRNVSEPLKLTTLQQDVLDVLKSKETEKYPLSQWYLGALYALDNYYNPDRISQAAQSLRELLEKLPRVVHGSDVQGNTTNFANMRRSISRRILKAKKRYPKGWENEKIDANLAKTLSEVESYLEYNRQPSRKEQMQRAVTTIDPMVNSLDVKIQNKKRDRLHDLWERLEGFAHHKSGTDVKEFDKYLKELEDIVFDLLAPITAQDQQEIQAILSHSNRSESDVERMFLLIERRGANFVFFFKQASENADIAWLPFLEKKGYFAAPPSVQPLGGGRVNFPFWWPMHYLVRISKRALDEDIEAIVELVLGLPKVDNPLVYDGILDIALQLSGEYFARLKPKILEYTSLAHQLSADKYVKLLAHWIGENQTSAALKLAKLLIEFTPDPYSESKQKRRKENPMDMDTVLEPSPRMMPGEYHEILQGIRSLAENEPYKVACILVDATKNMIYLRRHKQDLNKEEDVSSSWCPCLHKVGKDSGSPEEALVHTLTFACEKVFEKSPNAIGDLDKTLRNQHWKIFKRLRHHLYAKYPNEQTKPWILDLILTPEYYNQWKRSYEFQLMIRRACEHFGETLLTKEKRTQIFDAILAGPSKVDYQKWVEFFGIEFTNDGFQQYKRSLHRIQLAPFAPVLFGKYETYLQELEIEDPSRIFDEDYLSSKVRSGVVSNRSPRTPEDLSKLTDEELLTFINDWEESDERFEENSFVRIDITALANAFQTVFRESIISDPNRLKFWMDNRERIERPIYVRVMIYAMRASVKAKNFDKLKEWFPFCEWVLSHPAQVHKEDYTEGDESRENRNWTNARRAVCDFIGVCLEKDVDVPITARKQLVKLLETLCTQYDRHLDENEPKIINGVVVGNFNATRNRALENLVKFGFWLRRHEPECEVPEVTTILKKRFSQKNDYPLTLPEYAILGENYRLIYDLNEAWAIQHKSDFFPQTKLQKWVAAFSSFVLYNGAVKSMFKLLEKDFTFALEHLNEIKEQVPSGDELIDVIGGRLFNYYMWEMFPLKGQESLLERFYQQTDNDREHWANLFEAIGDRLSSTGEDLDQSMKDSVRQFFEWRFEQGESTELQHFTFWLEAKCLEAKWRLAAYAKILDVCEIEHWEINLTTLCEMLPDHTPKVVECFFKLTKRIKKDNPYVLVEEAKIILGAGLESRNESVRYKAELARENLLRAGKIVLSDLDD